MLKLFSVYQSFKHQKINLVKQMLQERKLYLFQQDGTQDMVTINGIQKVNQNYKETQHSYLMVHIHTITQHRQLGKLNKVMNLLMEEVFL